MMLSKHLTTPVASLRAELLDLGKKLEDVKGPECFQFSLRAGQGLGGAKEGRVKGLRPREVGYQHAHYIRHQQIPLPTCLNFMKQT